MKIQHKVTWLKIGENGNKVRCIPILDGWKERYNNTRKVIEHWEQNKPVPDEAKRILCDAPPDTDIKYFMYDYKKAELSFCKKKQ